VPLASPDSWDQRSRDTEADKGAPIVFGVVVARSRTGGLWNLPHDPRTAANDMIDAIRKDQSRAIRGRSIVIVFIAILDPFPNVPVHIVQAERIGGK
jgi:hypothetical protein